MWVLPNVVSYPSHMIFEQIANLLWRSWTFDGSIREGEDRVAFLEILDGTECTLHSFRRIIGANSWVGPCFRHTFNLNKRKYFVLRRKGTRRKATYGLKVELDTHRGDKVIVRNLRRRNQHELLEGMSEILLSV